MVNLAQRILENCVKVLCRILEEMPCYSYAKPFKFLAPTSSLNWEKNRANRQMKN